MKRRFNALLSQAWQTGDERQVLALFEEAIVIADRFLTETDAYEARIGYTRRAVEFGFYERMFVSFAWCWSKFLRNPGRYSGFYMLWQFKWIIGNLWKCTAFPLEQLEGLFALFREYCAKYGYSPRPGYGACHSMMLGIGRPAEADECYRLWRTARRDALANCPACERHAMGTYYIEKGQYRRGLQILRPILEGGLSCSSVPGSTYEAAVRAYMALGRIEDARAYADRASRELKGSGSLYEFGTLIAFYAIANRRKALRLLRNTYPYVRLPVSDWEKLHYLVGVQFLLDQEGGAWRRTGSALPEPDRAWVRAEIERLAKAFDERNRNRHVSRRVEELGKRYAAWKAALR
ncbi:MAG: hypothetical protein A9Z00_08960 [Thermobacillus sp. ZCTH02-B1]|uniref:hypothetical protein n=1 Tax=Thermobacillus sp. ZCTH02-B1 TaxID=1858795 RepID=UPI000B54F497|nr:hypothetical protein [Thermobacillus sp. ZCTH02-B1]OUM94726.1 MAG: hypothetical protein A9Z00_08960 [Thermobacillus sp. ZCTH02-B1]